MNKNKGFSLAELLIIIAIIGVLVGICIPIFFTHLERSRQTVDLSNMRAAKSATLIEWMTSPTFQTDTEYYYNGANVTTAPPSIGYGKSSTPVDQFYIVMPEASGIPKDNFLIVKVDSQGNFTMRWGQAGNQAYIAASTPYKYDTLMDLKNKSNADRIAADQTTMRAIGEEILAQGWTIKELKQNLGILVQGNTVRIANYYQLKQGSYNEGETYSSSGFKIDGNQEFLNILTTIGYDGGRVISSDSASTTYTNSLFYSDELASNKFKNYPMEETMRSIIIENIKTDSSGKITKFTIYTKAMEEQANLNNQEKALFRFTIE